ncbi:hypothetical protein [Thiolapillus sp.]|uniref:hypothetical protein n=1 Tax=Thiolapillus sp. TaxID=2017437 RepID=UPI0025CF7C7D
MSTIQVFGYRGCNSNIAGAACSRDAFILGGSASIIITSSIVIGKTGLKPLNG